ncbi:polymorphic toxin-type HINT domain-containing protein [Tautonia marina]|uniref:polymorphic toxin-type HINT domain-containing protein n=1 Tax=Tautonia marina TaxID=2653855 RepID=UPI001261255A|nr:polymorphic toxin-type HINT domain-containing protein [Tautonia marina]
MCCPSMIGPVWIVSLGLSFGTGVSDAPPLDPAKAAYQAAAAAAGRDADAQLQLSLWCEAQGRLSEAQHHLALAVLIDPDHAAARALMGRVRFGESWVRPGDVPRRYTPDPDRAALREEYEGRRSRLDPTADAHWKLALWCEQKGLLDEATAHFTAVTRLNPKREAAWKRLGYTQKDGRWLTQDQIAVEEAEAAARAAVEAEWRPRLEQWAAMLADPARRGEAITGLGSVDHPLLVPAVWSVLVAGPRADQPAAVQVLGQIDARDASRALAQLAVLSDDAEVRRVATETLRRRDPREWAGPLVGSLRDLFRYEVRPVGGPGSPGVLYIEGEKFDTRRFYEVRATTAFRPPMPGEVAAIGPDGTAYGMVPQIAFGQPSAEVSNLAGRLASDPQNAVSILKEEATRRNGASQLTPTAGLFLRGAIPLASDPLGSWAVGGHLRPIQDNALRNYLFLQQETLNAQQRLEADLRFIEETNAAIVKTNQQVLPVLQQGTGLESGLDRQGWQDWFLNQIGFQAHRGRDTARRPIIDQRVMFGQLTTSCFAAGTPVWTDRGTVPIEDLILGDLVLSQDTTTGALSYRPIIATHHNPPSKTFEVRIDGETIVASEFHRFWVAGRGWVMARDLDVGDVVRALGRTAAVEAIDDGQVQPVFNLSVADSRSFFVGELGALVHDNSLPSATIAPFDAVPDLAALKLLEAPEADSGG